MVRVATGDFKEIKVGLGFSFLNNIKEIPRALGSPDDPNAVCNNVDYIFAGDGGYWFYNLINPKDSKARDNNQEFKPFFSTDGTYEYIESTYKNAVMYKYSGSQVAKRQQYLDLACSSKHKCNFLIVMDTDEYIDPKYQDWTLFYNNLYNTAKWRPNDNVFFMKCFMNPNWKKAFNKVKNNMWRNYVKIHRNPGQFRYAFNKHFWWTRKKYTDDFIVKHQINHPKSKIKFQEMATVAIDGVRINTDSLLRDELTLKLRQKFSKTTIHYEQFMEGKIYHENVTGIKQTIADPFAGLY